MCDTQKNGQSKALRRLSRYAETLLNSNQRLQQPPAQAQDEMVIRIRDDRVPSHPGTKLVHAAGIVRDYNSVYQLCTCIEKINE